MCVNDSDLKRNLRDRTISYIYDSDQIAYHNGKIFYLMPLKKCTICNDKLTGIFVIGLNKCYYILSCDRSYPILTGIQTEYKESYMGKFKYDFIAIPEIGNAIIIAARNKQYILIYFESTIIHNPHNLHDLSAFSDGTKFACFITGSMDYIIIDSNGKIIPYYCMVSLDEFNYEDEEKIVKINAQKCGKYIRKKPTKTKSAL